MPEQNPKETSESLDLTNEEELATLLRETGDERAFRALLSQHGGMIASFLFRLSGGEAGEMLLEKVFRHIRDRSYVLREPKHFSLWAIGIAASIWREEASSLPAPETPSPAFQVISSIPLSLRPAFVLLHYFQFSLLDIATALRISQGIALTKIHEAFTSISSQVLPPAQQVDIATSSNSSNPASPSKNLEENAAARTKKPLPPIPKTSTHKEKPAEEERPLESNTSLVQEEKRSTSEVENMQEDDTLRIENAEETLSETPETENAEESSSETPKSPEISSAKEEKIQETNMLSSTNTKQKTSIPTPLRIKIPKLSKEEALSLKENDKNAENDENSQDIKTSVS